MSDAKTAYMILSPIQRFALRCASPGYLTPAASEAIHRAAGVIIEGLGLWKSIASELRDLCSTTADPRVGA